MIYVVGYTDSRNVYNTGIVTATLDKDLALKTAKDYRDRFKEEGFVLAFDDEGRKRETWSFWKDDGQEHYYVWPIS